MIEDVRVARAYCNGCRTQFPLVCPRSVLRDRLKADGWKVGPGDRCVCPECSRKVIE